MRMCSVPRQLLAVVMGGVLVGGCSAADFVINPVGVGSPSPTKVAGYLQETQDGAILNASGRPMNAGEYLIASMAFTNEKCHAFFDTLERFKEDSTLIDKVLNAAAAAGSPLLAATNASGLGVAQFTGILNFSNLINNNYREIYTFADFKEPLQTHVFDVMADFRSKNGLSTLTRSLIGVNLFHNSKTNFINPVDYRPQNVVLNSTSASCSTADNYGIVIPAGVKADGTPDKVEMSVNYCKINEFLHSTDPIHIMVARNIASEYASLCSIANMRTIIFQALHSTKSKVDKPDSAASKTIAADQ